MTFISCGRHYLALTADDRLYESYYTTRFSSVQLIEVTNCVFHDSTDTAVGVLNSTAVVRGSNTFSSNCRICSERECVAEYECWGGGIYVETGNVTFHGNNTFHRNSAKAGGGVSAWYSNVTFMVTTLIQLRLVVVYLHGTVM